MKVDFILTHPSHGSPGSFYRPYELAKELQKNKINASILTPFQDDVNNIHDIPMKHLPKISNMVLGSNFFYNNVRKILYSSKLSKIISYDKFLLSLSEKIANGLMKYYEDLPDIVQAEQEVAGLACIKIKEKLNIPIIVDFHNIWAEELVATGHLKPDHESYKNLIKIDQEIIDQADGIIAVNDFMKDYLISKFNADGKKITVIPPGGRCAIDNIEQTNIERFQTKKIVYAGLVSPREHVDLFINSIPKILEQFPNIQIQISDKGESISQIKTLSKKLGIKPEFTWYKTREQAQQMLKTCYVAALPSQNDLPRKLGTPLKLLEYMSFGLPVIANDVGSWCDLIKKYDLGLLVDNSPHEYANAVNILLKNEDRYLQIQENMKKALEENLSWEHHVSQLLLPLYQKFVS